MRVGLGLELPCPTLDGVRVRVRVRVRGRVKGRDRVKEALPHLGRRVIGLGRRLEEPVHLGIYKLKCIWAVGSMQHIWACAPGYSYTWA